MNQNRQRNSIWASLRIVAIYALVSGLWIYYSDTILGTLISSREVAVAISIYKGFFFVVVTSALLYFLILQSTKRFEVSEQQFRMLVEQAPEAIVVFDAETDQIVMANEQAVRLFDCPAPELTGSNILRFFRRSALVVTVAA